MRPATVVGIGLQIWLLLALAAGASGQVARLQPPAPQILLASLTAAAIAALWLIRPVRSWATKLNPQWFVAVHLTRFVGIYFLFLHSRGELPTAFAVPGGWGDIAVAALAAGLLLLGPPVGRRRWWYLTWNVLGLLDILFVAGTATRLAMAEPASMEALLRLPLSLLPTFLVPLIIASHLWLFRRLLSRRG